MKPPIHAAVSAAGAIGLYLTTGSVPAAVWSVVAGLALDFDHLPEYIWARRRFSPRDFFEFWESFDQPRLILPLHAWEYVPVLAALALGGAAPAVTWGLAFGLTHHLLLDEFGNGLRPGAYSLLRRIFCAFHWESLKRMTAKENV